MKTFLIVVETLGIAAVPFLLTLYVLSRYYQKRDNDQIAKNESRTRPPDVEGWGHE